MKLYYIKDEKLYCFDGKRTVELKSTALEGYSQRLYQNAKSQEWKTQGNGARFTSSFDPMSAEDYLNDITVYTDCVQPTEDGVLFSQTIDGISGLYIKKDGAEDGILFSDNNTLYSEFDLYRGQIVIAADYASEKHIAVCPKDSVRVCVLTEGETLDSHPVWSRFEDGVIYYSSAGLELRSDSGADHDGNDSPMNRMMTAQRHIARNVGPTSLCRFDTARGEIIELLSNEKLDYVKPQTDSYGNLYFIKRPYRPIESHNVSVLGCFLDLILFPFRLCRALLGFLNIFSMVYSGKTIRKSGGTATKNQDKKNIVLDGNIINAKKELKKNRKKGDSNPGVVPREYELCRISPNGETTVLKKGVIAYRVTDDGVYYSNGSAILYMDHSKKETLITKDERVTYLSVSYEDSL